jgi:hypothetical protein
MTLAFMTVFAIMIDERLGAGIGGKVRSYFMYTPPPIRSCVVK